MQLSFLEKPADNLPSGFRYQEGLINPAEETNLIQQLSTLPFKEFEFQGYKGKRRVVSFGWHYDFNHGRLVEAEPIPFFLRTLASKTDVLGFRAQTLAHILVTEYAPGAGIGWHKDRPVFEDVVGISLGAECNFRLRFKDGSKWKRISKIMPPRSAYLMSGSVRWEWEHSIPPVEQLRYSITFRNFRATQ